MLNSTKMCQTEFSDKTVGDVMDFIKNHKHRTTVFHQWKDNEIMAELIQSAETEGLSWSETDDGVINGVLVSLLFPETKTLRVIGIICDTPSAFSAFGLKYLQLFKGWTIKTRRNGKYITYNNPTRLCRLISTKA